MKRILLALFLLSTFIYSPVVLANNSIPVERPENLVYDPYEYIDEEVEYKLQEINSLGKTLDNRPEVGIVVINSLEGKSIEELANKTAKDWKIGFNTEEDKEYGLLLFVSIEDRKIRTELSNNMMTIIDNSGQDLTDSVKPYFRNNKYSDGISNYLSLIEGKYLGTNSSNNSIINDISYQFTNPKTVLHQTNKYLMVLLIPLFIITFVAFMIKKMFNYLFGLESYSPRYTPPKYHGSGITKKSSHSSSSSSSNNDMSIVYEIV